MKNNKNDEKQQVGKTKKELTTNSFRSAQKVPGTRNGTWEDWREGSRKSGKIAGRHGHAIRDGR